MTTMRNQNVVDPARTSDIAKAIYAAVRSVGTDGEAVAEAQGALNGASAARTSGREGVLLALADLARSGAWTAGEVSLASAQAVKMENKLESQKAIATFMADCRAAMDPKVRDHVPAFRDLRDTLWTEEQALPKDLPRPFKKAFARSYHMLKSMMVEAKEGRLVLSASDALIWADERDPDVNPKAIAGKLAAMRDQIAAIAGNFPVEAFASVTEFLAEISEETLKAARQGLLRAQEDVLQAHNLTPTTVVAPVVSPTVVNAPAPTPASDPLEDYLGTLAA